MTRPRQRLIAWAATVALAASVGLTACAQAHTSTTPARSVPTAKATTLATGKANATLYATGTKNVTSMAWGDHAMFAGASSGGGDATPNGGVFIIAHGSATEIPDSPAFVGGMVFHDGALYLSDIVQSGSTPQFRIERWSGFTGTTFSTRKVLVTGPAKFQGFNGLAFGPDGRLYVGVDVGLLNGNDHGPVTTSPDLYRILSMTADGTDVKQFASGIRQPWQIAFPAGSDRPFVSDLGQDGPASVAAENPPDFVLRVSAGQNYGFPACNFTPGSPCSTDAQPFKEFPAHTSIMGLAVVGPTLYMTSYDGIGGSGGGALLSVPVSGGSVSDIITGLPIFADVLAFHAGKLYIGGATDDSVGRIYTVTP